MMPMPMPSRRAARPRRRSHPHPTARPDQDAYADRRAARSHHPTATRRSPRRRYGRPRRRRFHRRPRRCRGREHRAHAPLAWPLSPPAAARRRRASVSNFQTARARRFRLESQEEKIFDAAGQWPSSQTPRLGIKTAEMKRVTAEGRVASSHTKTGQIEPGSFRLGQTGLGVE